MEKILGFLAPAVIYLFITILNALLPGRWVIGYVTKENSDEKLRYRLNGILVFFVMLLLWIGLCYSGYLRWDWLYDYRWYGAIGAIVFGLIFSLIFGNTGLNASWLVTLSLLLTDHESIIAFVCSVTLVS